ncbi:hypothetical protein BJ138DRAFT_1184600, partial [Hygrophoropsis aurantiaca]
MAKALENNKHKQPLDPRPGPPFTASTVCRLIECMPRHLWDYESIRDDWYLTEFLYRFCGTILPSDWAAFEKYACRVHTVNSALGPLDFVDMDNRWHLAFFSPAAPSPLLPNLESLTWSIQSDFELLTLSRLLSPSLRALKVKWVYLSAPPRPKYQCEQSLPADEIRSSLRYFTEVEDPDRSDADNVLHAIKRSLKDLHNLDRITWKALGSEGILTLAQLPALRHATFDIPGDFAAYIDSRSPKHPFSRLCELDITHETDAPMTAFLNYFDFHSLEEIYITSSRPSVATGTRAFYAALAASLSRESIRKIGI